MTKFEMSIPDLNATVAKITTAVTKLDQAALYAVGQVGLALEAQAKNILYNNKHREAGTTQPRGKYPGGNRRWFPSGHVGGDGSPPNLRTGELSRSIYTTVRHESGSYVATVFPTVVYARSLELGNPKWKSGVKYPYLVPAFNKLRPRMTSIFERGFARKMGG